MGHRFRGEDPCGRGVTWKKGDLGRFSSEALARPTFEAVRQVGDTVYGRSNQRTGERDAGDRAECTSELRILCCVRV